MSFQNPKKSQNSVLLVAIFLIAISATIFFKKSRDSGENEPPLEKPAVISFLCKPGSTQGCRNEDGTGTRSCNSSGTAYGAFEVQDCDPGYELRSGQCHSVT